MGVGASPLRGSTTAGAGVGLGSNKCRAGARPPPAGFGIGVALTGDTGSPLVTAWYHDARGVALQRPDPISTIKRRALLVLLPLVLCLEWGLVMRLDSVVAVIAVSR